MEKHHTPTDAEKKEWEDLDGPAKQSRATAEHERYKSERSDLLSAENDAEKNFDTLLVTISSIAIAASFTLMKDVVKATTGSLVLAWLCLGICLVGSLVDRLYTYHFHKQYRKCLDDVFMKYHEHPGHGWSEAQARRAELCARRIWSLFPAEKFLTAIKWMNAGFLALGLAALMLYVSINGNAGNGVASSTNGSVPLNINVISSSSQATTKP